MTSLPDTINIAKKKEWFKDGLPIRDQKKFAWSFKINSGHDEKFFYVPDGYYNRFVLQLIKDVRENNFTFPIWQCLSPMFIYFQLVTLTESQKKNKEKSIKKLVEMTTNEIKKYNPIVNELEGSRFAHIYYAAEEFVYITYPYFFVYEELAKQIHNSIQGFILSPLEILPLVPGIRIFEPCRECTNNIRKVKACNTCLGLGKGRLIQYEYKYSLRNGDKFMDLNDSIRIGLIHIPFEINRKKDNPPIEFPALDGTIVKNYWERTIFEPNIPFRKEVICPDINEKQSNYNAPKYQSIEEKVNNVLTLSGLDYGNFKIVDVVLPKNRQHIHHITMKNTKNNTLQFDVLSSGNIKIDIEKSNKRFKEKELIKSALESITDVGTLNPGIKTFKELNESLKKRKRDIELYCDKKKRMKLYSDTMKQLINASE